jgi:hypothetical protein
LSARYQLIDTRVMQRGKRAAEINGGSRMEQFDCHDPATRHPVEVQLLDTVSGGDPSDDYREVRLLLHDGRRYTAACWRDPQGRGGHWWEEPGMLIVRDLTTTDVLAAVEEVLRRGAVDEAFEPLAKA